MAWVGLATVGRFLLQLAVLPVLSRLLGPHQYGLATLSMTVVAFVTLFTEFGLSPFIIQARSLSPGLLNRVLRLDLLVTVGFAAALALTAPLVSSLLHAPALAPVLVVSSIACALTVKSVPLGLLEREMKFANVAVVELIAYVFGQGISVSLAERGHGALSISWGLVATTAVTVGGYWFLARWRPRRATASTSMTDVLDFTWPLMAFNFVSYWSRNLDNIVLARFGSLADLGYYGRAYQLMLLPVQQVATVAGRVMLPTLSKARRAVGAEGGPASGAVAEIWLSACQYALFIGLPMSVGLAVGGPDLAVLYLGPHWAPVGPLIGILGAAIAPQLLGRLSGSLYQALDLTRRQLVTGMINTAIMVTLILSGLPWGRVGVAVGVASAFWLQSFVVIRDLRRRAGISVRALAGHAKSPVVAALALSVCGVVLRGAADGWSSPQRLLLLATVLPCLYLAALLALPDGRRFLSSSTSYRRHRRAA